jgi:hypothetical protein
MNSFPDKLNSEHMNKDVLAQERALFYLRKKVTDFIIFRRSADEYFDLADFNRRTCNSVDICKYCVDKVIAELSELRWTAKYAFGGTALFIYTGTPPRTYVPESSDL